MKKIIKPRGAGKTTELIKLSHDTWTYILVTNAKRQKEVFSMARKIGIDIPNPVTVDDYMRTQFKGSYIKNILIDDAEDVLKCFLSRVNIDAITLTKEDE